MTPPHSFGFDHRERRPLRREVVDQRNDPAESSKVTRQMIDDGVAYVQTSAVGAETTEE